MAESLEGSFTFTVMDSHNGIYFVKGNNPLTLYHWKDLGLYIYASTETILQKALSQMNLSANHEQISVEMGDILYIDTQGRRKYGHFNYDHLLWKKHSWLWQKPAYTENAYLNDLKAMSYMFGFSPKDVDDMVADGMTAEDIEELYYCGVW